MTPVAMATKFWDKICYIYACIRDISETFTSNRRFWGSKKDQAIAKAYPIMSVKF